MIDPNSFASSWKQTWYGNKPNKHDYKPNKSNVYISAHHASIISIHFLFTAINNIKKAKKTDKINIIPYGEIFYLL